MQKTTSDFTNYPLVSVILPTFNYGHFIIDTLNNIRLQDYPNTEIIVIDDGSVDNTQDLLTECDDIQHIRQDNQGLSAARNHGIQLAKGKYLQFLDADDLLGPTSIHKRVTYLEEHNEKSFVLCRSAFFNNHTLPERLTFLHKEWQLPEEGLVDLSLYYFNIAPPHAFLVRKSVADRYELRFDPTLRACEDYDFWFRLAQLSGIPGIVKNCWVYYRQHPDSMSRSHAQQHRHDAILNKLILALSADKQNWLGERPQADYLSAMLCSALITARRLWQLGHSTFSDFIRDHVIPLQRKLAESQQTTPATQAAFLYLAKARVTLLNMWFSDKSLDKDTYKNIANTFPSNTSYTIEAVTHRDRSISLRTLLRLLKFDIQYAMLVLRQKLASQKDATTRS